MGSRQKKHGKFAVSIENDSEGDIELNQQTRRRRPRGPSAANRLLPEHNGLPGRSSQLAVLHQPGHNPESLEDEIGLFDVVPEDITSQGWDAYQDQLDNPCFSFASVELDDTSHGQACFCVPDFSADEHGEYAGITVESMVHVYRVALQFAHGESMCLFLCSCPCMQQSWNYLDGLDVGGMDGRECIEGLHYCQHALAVKGLHDSGTLGYDLQEDPCSVLNDVSLQSISQPITSLLTIGGVLLSFDSGEGHPCEYTNSRGVIAVARHEFVCRTCTNSKYGCRHIRALDEWQRNNQPEFLEGYYMRPSNGAPTGAHVPHGYDAPPPQSVSWLKIHEDCFNDTMAGRAFAQPLATDPQVSRVCIPDVPSDCQCDVCHEVPWDARDPV
eukprot:gene25274-10927_t